MQTTRLAFKLVAPVASQDTSRSSSNHEEITEEEVESELLDAPITLTIQSKVLPTLVIQSVCDKQDGEEGQRSSCVRGESGRSLRLRIFEGQIPPLTVRDAGEQELKQELADATEQTLRQWQFVCPQEREPNEDPTESAQRVNSVDTNGDQPQFDDPNATEFVKEESRLDEMLMTNSKGKATVEGLLLPSATLLGDYYLMCDNLSSDVIPPVYLSLSITS